MHARTNKGRTEGKKPFLASPPLEQQLHPQFSFNVSHSGDYVVRRCLHCAVLHCLHRPHCTAYFDRTVCPHCLPILPTKCPPPNLNHISFLHSLHCTAMPQGRTSVTLPLRTLLCSALHCPKRVLFFVQYSSYKSARTLAGALYMTCLQFQHEIAQECLSTFQ